MKTIEIAHSRSSLQRILLTCLGAVFVLGGIIGLFLPILPGFLLLVAGALLLSREFPPLHWALEKCQARFPIVRQGFAGLPRLHAAWRRCFSGGVHDSATSPRILDTPVPQRENLHISVLRRDKRQNSDCSEAVCARFKILVFDQNLEDLAWHAEPFEARGFEVYKCTTIEAALRCIEREELDFALVDQASATFEGLRVIRHLVRYNLRTPFIVLTRTHDVPCYQQALSLGAVDYLRKPVPVAEMDWMIDRYFGTTRSEKGYRERRDVGRSRAQ